jgi:DNA-binding XRE family transcriptional regulator
LDQLHAIHEQWREIGPAPKEVNDQLWEKFKLASDKTHVRKQALLEDNKAKQAENLTAKIALCEKMEADAEKIFDSHKSWQDANNAVEVLFVEWRKIGHVPKEDEEKTWKRFKEARQKFFRNRESYYAKQRDDFKKNLSDKITLCEKAESLKDSTDWKGTAMQFKRMQDDWKKIGPVPRKVSEKTWLRFKAAADAFFENRNKQFAAADAQLKENTTAREALIAEAEKANLGEDLASARAVLADLQKRWSELKPAPRNDFERLENAWKKVQEKLFAQLKEKGGDENTLQRIKYDQLKQTERGRDQIYRERSNIQEKIKKLQGEITTIENNLGMFSKSKGAQSLVADYQAQVEKHKAEVDKLKAQLKQIPRE